MVDSLILAEWCLGIVLAGGMHYLRSGASWGTGAAVFKAPKVTAAKGSVQTFSHF
jgi:hypothetical protein